ncbi:MAG: hypothetical protein NNA30_06985 [Nitrospira sp.]|nr:hypothetical protein [Nitrospira sp.]
MPPNKKRTVKEKDKSETGHVRGLKQAGSGYGRKTALLEEAITQMNAGKYGRASASLKELLAMDPHNMEARRLFATLHLRLGSLIPAKQAFDSLIDEAFARQDYWLAESLLREYLAAGPRCVPYLEKLGSIYQDKGQILDAVAEYAKAIDILMEDPDPDDPQYAARLYRQIRNLAPASPPAIRLNRYFDPQTGELIARPGDVSAHDSSPSDDDFAGDAAGLDDVPVAGEPLDDDGGATVEDGAIDDGPRDTILPQEPPAEINGAEINGAEWLPEPAPGERQSTVESDLESESEFELASHIVEAAFDSESTESSWLDGDAVTDTAARRLADEPGGDALTALSGTAVSVPDATVNGHGEVSCESVPEVSGLSADSTLALSTDMDHAVEPGASPPAISDDDLSPSDDLSPPMAEEAALDALPGRMTEEPTRPCEHPLSLNDRPSGPATEVWREQAGDAHLTVVGMPDTVQGSSPADQTEEKPATEVASPTTDEFYAIEQPSGFPIQPETDALTSILEEDGLSNESIEADETSWQDQTVRATSEEAPVPWDQVPDATIEIPEAQRDEESVELAVVEQTDSSEASVDSVAPSPLMADDPEPVLEQTIADAGETPSFAVLSLPSPPQESEETTEEMEEQRCAIIDAPVTDSDAKETDTNEPAFDVSDENMVDERVSTTAAMIEIPLPPEEEAATANTAGEKDQPVPVEASVVSEELRDQLEEQESEEALESPPESEAAPEPPLSSATEEPAIRDFHDGEAIGQSPNDVVWESPREPAPSPQETGTGWRPIRPADEPPVRSSIKRISSTGKIQPRLPADNQERNTFTSTASAAVDVLFETAGESQSGKADAPSPTKRLKTKRPGFPSRIGAHVSEWFRSCVSTTSTMVLFLVASVSLACAVVVSGIVAVGLTWVVMEEAPSPLYQHLTAAPPRTLSDPHMNGYLFLLGFDAPAGQDPIQAGLRLHAERQGANDRERACLGDRGGSSPTDHAHASARVLSGWMRGRDPVGALKANRALLSGWAGQGEAMLGRYRQWQRLPFEDWGFGLAVAPPCDSITFAHHLYIAEGFLQQTDVGLERLEADMEAWRIVLAQAKTLPIKVLAIQAVRDDATVASGLLADPDFDGKHLGRLSHLLRPLNQAELSIRWPMHGELAWAAASYDAQLKAETEEAHSFYTTLVSWFPLPKQRRLNGYAAYYDASYKAAHEGRHRGFPKRSEFSRSPAETMADVLANPIENIIGLDPLPAWDGYHGMAVDAEAHLRLAGLQAWIRRGGADAELFSRIAKAGQDFYDPYTGLPMLVNLNKGVLYSVGHDGKDQDGDPEYDVVVAIPASRVSALTSASAKPSTTPKPD